MLKHQKRIYRYLAPALALLLLCGCARVTAEPAAEETPSEPQTAAQPQTPAQPSQPAQPETPAAQPDIILTLSAVGDDLLHNTVSWDCQTADGGYDFTHLYAHIAPYVKGSDIAFVNQEVVLTGEVKAYPNLAAPAEAADALKAAGFNVVNMATNHALDQGVDGLETAIKNVRARNFDAVLGVHDSAQDADTPVIVEKQGVKIGFLSYTYDMNGYTLPDGKTYMIDVIDEAKMKSDLARIRPLCDYLIVSMHWGTEYQHEPNDRQRALAALLCEGGADLIIGTHPHVLQPAEWLKSADGSHQTLCAWSLGNFISGQHKFDTMIGGLLQMSIRFGADHAFKSVDSWGVAATVTHFRSKGGYAVYALDDYTDALAGEHGIRNYDTAMSLDGARTLAQKVLGDALAAPVKRGE